MSAAKRVTGVYRACRYCGNRLKRGAAGEDKPETADHAQPPSGFCSEQCLQAYEAEEDERWEEAQELHRAGAT